MSACFGGQDVKKGGFSKNHYSTDILNLIYLKLLLKQNDNILLLNCNWLNEKNIAHNFIFHPYNVL